MDYYQMQRAEKHMKHAKKISKAKKRRKRQLKRLRVLLILLVLAIAGAGISIYRDYQARPGFLEKIWIEDRGADFITVAWERPRNVYKYVITYNGETVEVSGRKKNARITGLAADTEYNITVRADSREREGFDELKEHARTKKTQTIEGESEQIRFANRPVDLKQTAVTDLTYAPGTGYTVTEDGKIVFTSAGNITVTAQASETEEYAAASKEINVEVLDTVNNDAAGAQQHIFYKLGADNCQMVMEIKGVKEAYKPQSFVRVNGQYLVAYIKDDVQRIVTFGDGGNVYTPDLNIGHANGLTIAGGRCYSVNGVDGTCVAFDPPSSNYASVPLAIDASGIAYDEANNLFYTSTRRQLSVYDSSFNLIKEVGRVARTTRFYAQDCTAYDGILMQVISGPGFMDVNYIDFYDMAEGKYLGSIECDLEEIESIIVDEEGYLEVLCNVIGLTDNIWKTPVNIKEICK